jgi:hypothetical protein
MAYTIDVFKTRFPELAAAGDDLITSIINEANLVLDEQRWGKYYTLGMQYFCAHQVYIAKQQAAGDGESRLPTHTMRAGSVLTGYETVKGGTFSENFFASTSYGQQFLKYRKTIGMGAFVV